MLAGSGVSSATSLWSTRSEDVRGRGLAQPQLEVLVQKALLPDVQVQALPADLALQPRRMGESREMSTPVCGW